VLTCQRIVKVLLTSREAFNVLMNRITTQRIITMIRYYFIFYIYIYIYFYFFIIIFLLYIFIIAFFIWFNRLGLIWAVGSVSRLT
jgi:hypothetical protein